MMYRAQLQHLARMERCFQDIRVYARHIWPAIEPNPCIWNWHMDIVLMALQRQVEADPDYRKILICEPPGTAKSLMVSVIQPTWEWFCRTPARRRIFFSSSSTTATRDSRRRRNLMLSDRYQELLDFAERVHGMKRWKFAKDQQEKTDYENQAMGFHQCHALGANFTGLRGDDYTIDDPIPVDDVMAGSGPRIGERVTEANIQISTQVPNRVNDLASARSVLMMQRLHPNDPAGLALRAGGYHIINLAMEFDEEDKYNHPDDPRKTTGELLFAKKFPQVELDRLKRPPVEGGMGPLMYQGMYNQKPVIKEGSMIRRELFNMRYTSEPMMLGATMDALWVSADANKKATGHDNSAIHVYGIKGALRYLLDRIARPMGYTTFERTMDGVHAKWNAVASANRIPLSVLVEDTANGATYLELRAGVIPNLIPFHPSSDTPGSDKSKVTRAGYLARCAEAGQLILPDPSVASWVEEVIDWWTGFPAATLDDDVDAGSQLLMKLSLADAESSARPCPVDQFAWVL